MDDKLTRAPHLQQGLRGSGTNRLQVLAATGRMEGQRRTWPSKLLGLAGCMSRYNLLELFFAEIVNFARTVRCTEAILRFQASQPVKWAPCVLWCPPKQSPTSDISSCAQCCGGQFGPRMLPAALMLPKWSCEILHMPSLQTLLSPALRRPTSDCRQRRSAPAPPNCHRQHSKMISQDRARGSLAPSSRNQGRGGRGGGGVTRPRPTPRPRPAPA